MTREARKKKKQFNIAEHTEKETNEYNMHAYTTFISKQEK